MRERGKGRGRESKMGLREGELTYMYTMHHVCSLKREVQSSVIDNVIIIVFTPSDG